MSQITLESMGRNLQMLRKSRGFKSAKAFAETAGIKVATYTTYEQGRYAMSLDTACVVADILGVTLDELVGRSAHKTPQDTLNMAPDERQLIASYRSMNNDGKSALLASATGMERVFSEVHNTDRRTA